MDDLEELVRESESARVELKREISEDVVRGLSTDIAALANYEGGYIIFGFTDDKEPVGCSYTSRDLDRISQEAKNCRPPVKINVKKMTLGSKRFLIMEVPRTTALHSDIKHRFPIRIGSLTDFLEFAGILEHIRGRGLLPRESPKVISSPPVQERKALPEDEASMVVEGLSSRNPPLRLEALQDLRALSIGYAIFEDDGVVDSVQTILKSGTDDEVEQILDAIRIVASRGSPSEKEVISSWAVDISEMGKSTISPRATQRAFDVLLCLGHTGTVDVLTHWVKEADDYRFKELQPGNLLANVKFYGLDNEIRRAMYGLLKSKPTRKRVAKRVPEILEALRRAY